MKFIYTRFWVKINRVKLHEGQSVRRPRYGLDGPWSDRRNVQTDPGAHTTVLNCLEGIMRPKHKADHTPPSTPRSPYLCCSLQAFAVCTGSPAVSWLQRSATHQLAAFCPHIPTEKRRAGGTLLAVFPGTGKSSGDRDAHVLQGTTTTRHRGIRIAQYSD